MRVCLQGFLAEFLWPGTQDWCGWLSVTAALAVVDSIGLQRLRHHNGRLLEQAVQLLCTACRTDVVLGGVTALFWVCLGWDSRLGLADGGVLCRAVAR